MLKLFLDTSNKYLYLGIMKDNQIIEEILLEGNNNHSEKLIDVIKETFQKNQLTPDDLDEIYVGRGPGSYTGVRVSGTVAKTLAFIKNKKMFTFSSLDLILSNKLGQEGIYQIAMDARRGFSYAKVVEVKADSINVIMDESYVETEWLEQQYGKYERLDIENNQYRIDLLLKYQLIKEVTDIHSFVPTYLRSGI